MTGIEGVHVLEDVPLFGSEAGHGCAQDAIIYDEDGSLAFARAVADAASPAAGPIGAITNPCPSRALDGSWFLQLTKRTTHAFVEIRGPMRIEVGAPRIRVSGDIYVSTPVLAPFEVLQPILPNAVPFGLNWYPQLPQGQYSWYFRSTGAVYSSGQLTFGFVRHIWDSVRSEFVRQDSGQMQFRCEQELVAHQLLPQPTLQMRGTVQLGGELYDAIASKTSPFYRGCPIEVDVMTDRNFPLSATTAAGIAVSFESIYRTAGWDCPVSIDQRNLAVDTALTTSELQLALTGNRRPATSPDGWRLWLMVGSGSAEISGLFGIMFDQTAPHREGAVGFFDTRLTNDANVAPAARGKKIGEVAAAFLRTMVHEAGHAFNLFHPKADVHPVPVGTSIMNQTGDVMAFATTANTFPGVISFSFDDHNRTSLIHSPDPQVSPGWKPFGWGHGDLSSGLPAPIDALGITRSAGMAEDLHLEMIVPDTIFRGEFVSASFVVTNRGVAARALTAAINLAQGDLRLLLTPPNGQIYDVRDSIIVCGDRPMMTLQPGESVTGNAQIFFTNQGFTFRQTGRYYVSAELDVGDGSGEIVRSESMTVVVRAPITAEEEEIARLSLKPAVGAAFALGDYGVDESVRQDLSTLAEGHGGTDTGIAAALVLANSAGSALRDLRSGKCLREANKKTSNDHFARAADAATARGAWGLVRLATAVAAPTEAHAPVLRMTEAYLRDRDGKGAAGARKGGARKGRDRTKLASGGGADYPALSGADLLDQIRGTFAGR